MLLLVHARLLYEDHLVDAGIRVTLQVLADAFRRPDAAGARRLLHVILDRLKALPQIGAARTVLAVNRIMRDRVAEEAETIEAAAHRLLAVFVNHHAVERGDVGVHRMPDRHAFFGFDDLIIFVPPYLGLRRLDKSEHQRPDAVPCRAQNALAPRAGHPDRRMRLLYRLRHNVANGHREELPLIAGIRPHRHHVRGLLDAFPPHRGLLLRFDPEAVHFDQLAGLPRTPFNPAAGEQVERCQALGDARGMIVVPRRQTDAVADANVFCALRN